MAVPVSSNKKKKSQPFSNKKLFQKLSCFFNNISRRFWSELPLRNTNCIFFSLTCFERPFRRNISFTKNMRIMKKERGRHAKETTTFRKKTDILVTPNFSNLLIFLKSCVIFYWNTSVTALTFNSPFINIDAFTRRREMQSWPSLATSLTFTNLLYCHLDIL